MKENDIFYDNDNNIIFFAKRNIIAGCCYKCYFEYRGNCPQEDYYNLKCNFSENMKLIFTDITDKL